MLKVVHVITGLGRGGAEGALYRLCHADDVNQAVVVSLIDEGVYGPRLRALGVVLHVLGMRSLVSLPMAFLQLRRILKREAPDVVQTWMYHADLVGGLAALSLGIPVCWSLRQGTPSRQSNKRSTLLIVRICVWLSGCVPSRVISCSIHAAESHRSIGYKASIDVVPNGFDIAPWSCRPLSRASVRARLGTSSDTFVFAHAGRGDPQKDHRTLALAFNSVLSHRRDACLLLCGVDLEPGNAYFEALPFTTDARRSVIALGARDDLPELWQGCDAFVLSSIDEGFPNVVAEAMAGGMPCIVTDVGDAAYIVGETGYVVPPSDPEALARAMTAMMSLTPSDQRTKGAAAKHRVASKFTLDRMVEGFNKIWCDVVGKRRASCAD